MMFHSIFHLFTAVTLFLHPHSLPHTPGVVSHDFRQEIIHAQGNITEFGKTIQLHAVFPQEGGDIHGSVSGDCTGIISGKYTGEKNGKTLTGKAEATCPIFFLTLHGSATFTGTVNDTDSQANLNYTAAADGQTQTGSFTFSLSH